MVHKLVTSIIAFAMVATVVLTGSALADEPKVMVENKFYSVSVSTDAKIVDMKLTSDQYYDFNVDQVIVAPFGTKVTITSNVDHIDGLDLTKSALVNGKIDGHGGSKGYSFKYEVEDGYYNFGSVSGLGAKVSFVLEKDVQFYTASVWDSEKQEMIWTVIKVDATAPSSWAREQIDSAKALNLVTDKVLSNFQQKITREEFCELVIKLYESLSGTKAELPEVNKFTDTTNPEILKANALGIVNGTSDTKFSPNATITREQIAVMFYNTIKAVDPTALEGEFTLNFADKDIVSKYAVEALAYMSNKQIISGVGQNKVDPKGTASREVAISLVVRTYEAFK